MTTKPQNILILGGGCGGVMTALRLAHKTRQLNLTITLINALDHFVERCRLHEQATGLAPTSRPLIQMLRGTRVRFLQGWVTTLDPTQQCVHVQTADGEQQLAYDYLVNALGSSVNRQTVAGVQEYAYTLDPYGDLTTAALQAKLVAYGQDPLRVVVVGGGATGIEAATQIKGSYPHSTVALVTQGKVGAFKGPTVQRHFVEALTQQQITIHEAARVIRVEPDGVVLGSGKLAADIVLWAGGFIASPLARAAGVQVNAQNQMLVDPFLRSISHPNLYAVGDAASPMEEPGAPVRMSLFTAMVSGAQAAENLAALLHGQAQQPWSFAWYGQGIALGPHDAVGLAAYPSDQPWPFIVRGKWAVRIRGLFVWYLVAALAFERRWPGSFYWNGRQRYAQQKRRQLQQTQTASRL